MPTVLASRRSCSAGRRSGLSCSSNCRSEREVSAFVIKHEIGKRLIVVSGFLQNERCSRVLFCYFAQSDDRAVRYRVALAPEGFIRFRLHLPPCAVSAVKPEISRHDFERDVRRLVVGNVVDPIDLLGVRETTAERSFFAVPTVQLPGIVDQELRALLLLDELRGFIQGGLQYAAPRYLEEKLHNVGGFQHRRLSWSVDWIRHSPGAGLYHRLRCLLDLAAAPVQ